MQEYINWMKGQIIKKRIQRLLWKCGKFFVFINAIFSNLFLFMWLLFNKPLFAFFGLSGFFDLFWMLPNFSLQIFNFPARWIQYQIIGTCHLIFWLVFNFPFIIMSRIQRAGGRSFWQSCAGNFSTFLSLSWRFYFVFSAFFQSAFRCVIGYEKK